MIAVKWLADASAKLTKAGIGSARLDALILLEDCLGKDRGQILAHPELPISNTKLKKLNSRLKRRLKHEPMAYIRGHSQFFGRKFKVNRHVLEPRPESEPMIDMLKKIVDSLQLKVDNRHNTKHYPLSAIHHPPVIADVGTGSGALGVTAALELHNHNVDLYDIDASALAVAKHNTTLHELHLRAYKRDLLSRCARPYDIILANLPYIPDHFHINQAAAMEPRLAIFGGGDGLDVYRRLFYQISRFNWKPMFILTESLPPQHSKLSEIATRHGFRLAGTDGFIQRFRLKA